MNTEVSHKPLELKEQNYSVGPIVFYTGYITEILRTNYKLDNARGKIGGTLSKPCSILQKGQYTPDLP